MNLSVVVVVATGPGAETEDDGTLITCDVKNDDTVLPEYGRTSVKIDGR